MYTLQEVLLLVMLGFGVGTWAGFITYDSMLHAFIKRTPKKDPINYTMREHKRKT